MPFFQYSEVSVAQGHEYLRQVSVGGLHTFAGQLAAITWLFTGAVCMLSYGFGALIGRWFGVWPIDRFLKRT